MIYSSNLNIIDKEFPLICEDVGISEEHAVSKAAGIELAKEEAVVSIYTTCMERAYGQILQPFPLHLKQDISTSKDGSVKGK